MSLFKLPLKSIEKQLAAKSIVTIKADETLINAIKLFRELKVSILPVTDGDNNASISGFLFLKDVFYLFAKEGKFSLSDPVSKLLTYMYKGIDETVPLGKERIIFVQIGEDNLKDVFEKMAVSPEKKIVVKNGENYLTIITISDLFNLLSSENI